MSQTAPLVVADEGYVPVGGAFDEAVEGDGSPRWHYQALLGALRQTDLEGLTGRVSDRLGAREVGFGTGARHRTFAVDPVPRIIPAAEWVGLEAGVAQRVRALNAFLADAYGDQRIVNAGRVPPRLIADAVDFEPMVAGFPPSGRAHAHIAGLDVVRDAGGKLLALEDNLRTPSGIAYADAARDAVGAHLPCWAACPPAAEGRRDRAGRDAARRRARRRRRAGNRTALRRAVEHRVVGAHVARRPPWHTGRLT